MNEITTIRQSIREWYTVIRAIERFEFAKKQLDNPRYQFDLPLFDDDFIRSNCGPKKSFPSVVFEQERRLHYLFGKNTCLFVALKVKKMIEENLPQDNAYASIQFSMEEIKALHYILRDYQDSCECLLSNECQRSDQEAKGFYRLVNQDDLERNLFGEGDEDMQPDRLSILIHEIVTMQKILDK